MDIGITNEMIEEVREVSRRQVVADQDWRRCGTRRAFRIEVEQVLAHVRGPRIRLYLSQAVDLGDEDQVLDVNPEEAVLICALLAEALEGVFKCDS